MQVSVQIAVNDAELQKVPEVVLFQTWVNAAVQHAESIPAAKQMTVRIVELEEIGQLNEQYRQKNGPTNVLSFPFETMPGMPAELQAALQAELQDSELGDVIVCAAVVQREALEQDKALEAHWAHMVVHGTLHLLGYDHIQDRDAEEMESLETAVLAELGYADPYL